MKFFVEKSELQEAISKVQKAITNKTTMPILEGILIKAENNKLILIGSNIELTIETKINADVIEDGSIVIDSKLFGEIIKKLPNSRIEIHSIDDNSINIECLKSKVTFIHMNADDYPKTPKINENMIFSIPQKLLKNMIKGTIFAIAQDETRPILTGVLFQVKNKKLNLVALDGYRVAVRTENINNDNVINAVIPGKTLNEVAKILEESDEPVHITFTPNHILFNLGNTKVLSILLKGEFIKYESIIPNEYNLKAIVKKNEILNSIEIASLIGKEGNNNLVKLDIKDDIIIVTSNSQLGTIREEVNTILQGESVKIAFNSKYLIDVFKIIEEEEIVMEFSSSISPCVVKNKENDNCTYLLLPVRLANNN